MSDTHNASLSLVAYGWNDRIATLFTMFPNRIPGRVVRVDRTRFLLATPEGPIDAQIGEYEEGSEAGNPATGDWVALNTEEVVSIVAILPRYSAIKRLNPSAPGARPEEQVLVANLDLAFVVRALDRPVQLRRLERTLVMAWESGGIPVVILTKADLLDEDRVEEAVQAVHEVAPGVDVLADSNVTGRGLEQLSMLLQPGKTTALIGESGSGKSTLINRLLDQQLQATGPARRSDGKGRHTTTSRELIVIPGRGVIIDTPGLRSIGLWNGQDGLAQAFPDIDRLAGGCRFADCRHASEPGCAIRAALEKGDLDPRRINSYRKMEREMAHQERQLNVRKQRADQRAAGRRYRRTRNNTVEW